jgi:hypothetical protein
LDKLQVELAQTPVHFLISLYQAEIKVLAAPELTSLLSFGMTPEKLDQCYPHILLFNLLEGSRSLSEVDLLEVLRFQQFFKRELLVELSRSLQS